MAAGRGCLSEDEVLDLVAGRIAGDALAAAEAHLDGCVACRRLIAGLAAETGTSDGSLATMLQALVATPAAAPVSAALRAGDVIADKYRVVRVLGRGGMGVVYLARDLRLGRDVALKVGNVVSEVALARIEREAVALAKLQHPNVVTVHEVGEAGGRLYIAMEHVAGGNVRDWLAAAPRGWRDVVRLYAAAGDGLAAAHAAGLIHRDFKPDNVLVGADDRPRVADFGLVRSGDADDVAAGATDVAALDRMTQTGAIVGTPAYMAPEQLAGEAIDARVDQFAFCVAVWEALFGGRPFAGRTPDELATAIETAGPRRGARGARARVPRHVIATLERGLSPDRARRWPAMEPLLAALRRDPAARLRRGAVAITALGVVAGATAVVLRADRAEPCADGPARIAEVWSADRAARIAARFDALGAGASWPVVRDRLDGFARAWTVAHRDACRATRVDGSQSEAVLDRRNLCLDRARAALDTIAGGLDRGERAAIIAAPDAIALLPDLAPCADVARLGTQPPLPADPARRARIAAVGRYLSDLEVHWGLGDNYQPRIAGAIAVGAARAAAWRPLVDEAVLLRAELLEEAGERAAAVRAYQDAVDEDLAGGDDDDALYAMTGLADQLAYDGDVGQAEQWSRLAHAEWRRLGEPANYGAHLLRADSTLAERRGDYAARVAIGRQALALGQRAWADEPVHLAINRANLAMALAEAGQLDEARPLIGQAVAGAQAALGADHPRMAAMYEEAAAVAYWGHRMEEAIELAKRAVAVVERWYGPDDQRLLEALDKLGAAQAFVDHDGARATITRELALLRRAGVGPIKIAEQESNLAVIDAEDGRTASAYEHGKRSLAILEEAEGADNPNLEATLLLVGITARQLGKLDESAIDLRRNAAIQDRAGADRPDAINAHIELSRTLVAQGKVREALDVLAPVDAAIARGGLPPSVAADGHFALATARWTGGDRARARADAAAARDGYAALGASYAHELAEVDGWLRAPR